MQPTIQNSILQILDLINYTGDKKKYVNDCLALCEKKALLEILNSLPQDKQESFKQDISNTEDVENKKRILQNYIPSTIYPEKLNNIIQDYLLKFMDKVIPTLNKDQLTKLESYLKTLS